MERICRQHDPLALAIAMQCQVSTLTLSVTFSTKGPSGTSRLRLADPVADVIADRIGRPTAALATGEG